MRTLEIHPFQTLKEILAGMPYRAKQSFWRIGVFREFNGEAMFEIAEEGTSELEKLLNSQNLVSFDTIEQISGDCGQVIWASFFCYDDRDTESLWMRVNAIDSSFWTVDTIDQKALSEVENTFENVRDGSHYEY